jgi:DNA-binding LytR/AlgR family response regulator
MIKAIALDDEPPALLVIKSFCNQTGFIELSKTFSKTEDAFKYLQSETVDLLFLDINMPSISGIDFYKQLPQKVMVIFTTAYTEYAVEGFNLQAIDYLLKPFTYQRFMQAVEKAKDYLAFQNKEQTGDKPAYIFLRVDYSMMKVAIADIMFIEGLDDYLKIHLQAQKTLVVRLTMKAMLEKLPDDFIRVHRSYIVSFRHVESVRNKVIYIAGEEIPIGSSYEDGFLKKFG